MSKQTVSNEYVSAFCLEMSLLLHAGIGIEDGCFCENDDSLQSPQSDGQGLGSGGFKGGGVLLPAP